VSVEPSSGGGARVRVTVRNTSERAGKEVVQVYVRAPDGIASGARELQAFTPVLLEPAARCRVELDLDQRAFRHWRDGAGWTVAPGTYEVFVGRSSRDVVLGGTVHVYATESA
jgi:beta-glucosidase